MHECRVDALPQVWKERVCPDQIVAKQSTLHLNERAAGGMEVR